MADRNTYSWHLLPLYAELQNARIPATAVEEAFGKAEAVMMAGKVAEAVETTEYVLMQKAAKDSFVP